MPAATGQPRRRDPFRAPASLCPETNPPSRQPTLGFQSIVRVLLFGSFFGYFPLSGGWGGRAPHAGLGTCPFPDASRAPTPPAAYVYNVQSIPPARKKELPRPVKMAGVQKEGMGASPLLRFQDPTLYFLLPLVTLSLKLLVLILLLLYISASYN